MEIGNPLHGKEATPSGRHLHEPDGYPHTMMALLAAIVVTFAITVGALYAIGKTVGAIVGAGIMLFVVVPVLVSRMNRKVQEERRVEIEQERRAEAQEHTGR